MSSAMPDQHIDVLQAFPIPAISPELDVGRLTRFAAQICETPIAFIHVPDRQWQSVQSILGLQSSDIVWVNELCARTMQNALPFIVSDVSAEPFFGQHPPVIDRLPVRFYAGIPLCVAQNVPIGTLAVMDYVPRQLNDLQITTLNMLAEQVVMLLQMRQQNVVLEGRLEECVKNNRHLFRQFNQLHEGQQLAKLGTWEVDVQTQQLACSRETCRILGIPYREEVFDLWSMMMRYVHPSDQSKVAAAVRAALQEGIPFDIEYRIVRLNGECRVLHSCSLQCSQEQEKPVIYGIVQDISEQRQSQEQLHLLAASVARLNDIVMITEAQPYREPGPRIVFVNQAFEQVTGYTCEEVIGKSPRFLQGPKTQRSVLDHILSAIKNGEAALVEVINYTKRGKEFWFEMHISPVTDDMGRITHFVAIQRDITQRKEAENQIEQLAFYDPLTLLPNRRLLMDRLQHVMAAIRRGPYFGALFFIDLDNFKSLNDSLGHARGDLLLKQVAARLQACVRKSNTVARLGGDEFVVMVEDLSPHASDALDQAETVGENILAAFNQPFRLDGYEHQTTASVGVALLRGELHSIDELMQQADLAMYQAKTAGRNTVRFFDPAMQEVVTQRVTLEKEIRKGLSEDEFVLYYQPQMDEEGRMTGVEALVRWNHPSKGTILPATFIPLAEDTGLIMQLGQWILKKACEQLASWEKQSGKSDLMIAVNVSARQFHHPEFMALILNVLAETGANPNRLKLELTESVLIENVEEIIVKMGLLKSKGISFALDDFGAGYSSLSYLKRLPLDQLKIDQSFVKDVLTDQNDAAITRTIFALGYTLGLEVMAEGVETEGQRNFLIQNGCRAFQGYYFSHPMPPELFQQRYSLVLGRPGLRQKYFSRG